ncbi:hypothetical protein [Nostoc sp.]|uniref:hypothetical protein n=1 Tax=Nostoc sp. TaxID=1180 RepID=UPI002FF8EC8E
MPLVGFLQEYLKSASGRSLIAGIILWSGWRKLMAGFKIKWSAHPKRLTAEFEYLNHIYRRGTAMLCPYRVVYLPENSCNL